MARKFLVELTIKQIERLVVEIQEEIEREDSATQDLLSQQGELEKTLFAYDRGLI